MNSLLSEIRILITVSSRNMKYVTDVGAQNLNQSEANKQMEAWDDCIVTVEKLAQAATQLLSKLNNRHVDGAITSFRNAPGGRLDWADLNRRSIALRNAIETELSDYLYYQYRKDKGRMFFNWKNDWKDVISAFPTAQDDIFSSVDCYALEHNTASVFHSVRIAELGLRAISVDRGLRLPKNKMIEWATWQEIIKALDEEIADIGTMPAGPDKDRLLVFYSGSRADLNGFKDEYRNVVMHVRMTFDEYQAASALTKVREFMKRLVTFGLSTV